jgi:hypothetical protein
MENGRKVQIQGFEGFISGLEKRNNTDCDLFLGSRSVKCICSQKLILNKKAGLTAVTFLTANSIIFKFRRRKTQNLLSK